MEQREIKWTPRAVQERNLILDYWYFRNKSLTYSVKLNTLFSASISLMARQPEAGKLFNREKSIYFILVKSYRIYFHFSEETFVVLSIWDTRRNPVDFKEVK